MHDLIVAAVFISMIAAPCIIAMFQRDEESA